MKTYLRTVLTRLKYGLGFTSLIVLFMLIVLWNRMVHMVPAGHEAVVWHSLRGNFLPGYDSNVAGEGLEIIWPWDMFYLYDLRLRTHTETYPVVSQEGLHFEIDMTFRWKVVKDNVIVLNRTVGQDYLNSMLIPEVGSILREIVANYPAEALYTTERNAVQDGVFNSITASSLPNHVGSVESPQSDDTILLQDTLMTNVRLPASLKAAIERKLSEQEMVAQYEFKVQRERLESERKQIEAEGVRAFQETVAPAITDSYLQWRGIEATIELAKSQNSKVVVIGNSRTGLPLILDMQEGTTAGSIGTGPVNAAQGNVAGNGNAAR